MFRKCQSSVTKIIYSPCGSIQKKGARPSFLREASYCVHQRVVVACWVREHDISVWPVDSCEISMHKLELYLALGLIMKHYSSPMLQHLGVKRMIFNTHVIFKQRAKSTMSRMTFVQDVYKLSNISMPIHISKLCVSAAAKLNIRKRTHISYQCCSSLYWLTNTINCGSTVLSQQQSIQTSYTLLSQCHIQGPRIYLLTLGNRVHRAFSNAAEMEMSSIA